MQAYHEATTDAILTDADREFAAKTSPFRDEFIQADELCPVEALREPWASWPEWTDERWTLSDAEADVLANQAEADHRLETLGYL
jgi:hypothetical protein